MSQKDGGSAFPALEEVECYKDDKYEASYMPVGGMSLRDYFAAKAQQTLTGLDSDNGRLRDADTAQRIASFSYLIADAMLAERAK